jgi:hypothetical protein
MTQDALTFARLVEALRPWLPVAVFIGGWAHRLHRQHPLARPLQYAPLMTRDGDVALDPREVSPTADIRPRLIDKEFVEDMTGEDKPPVTYYRFRDNTSPNYAEFLVPLIGGTHKRDGTPDTTTRIAGVSAQKLRYLELLFISPWAITLTPGDVPVDAPATIRLPNPASYLAQKILIHGYRKPPERAKDMLYVHDTLETFGGALSEIRRIWLEQVKPGLGEKQARRIEAAPRQLEAGITDDIREATLQARAAGRDLSADRLVQVCAYGLREIFGPEC